MRLSALFTRTKDGHNMSIWKFLFAMGIGGSLFLFGTSMAQYDFFNQILAIVAGIGAANFALLAVIAEKLSGPK